MIVWITHAKVGHRQAPHKRNAPAFGRGVLFFSRCSGGPGLDFGDARVAGEGAGDVDADTVGAEGSEAHRALDQVVAADRAQGDPRGAGGSTGLAKLSCSV